MVGSVTQIFIDNTDSLSNTQTGWYDTWDDSSNTTSEGYLYITSGSSTGTVVNAFNITSVTAAAGYYKIAVTFISGSLPADAAELSVNFSRTGDRGVQGLTGTATQGVQGLGGGNGAPGTSVQGANGAQGVQGIIGSGTQGAQGGTGSTGPVAGTANQVVYKDSGNNPAGDADLTFDGETLIAKYLGRADHHLGFLVGSYNNIAANSTKSNPIYTIGSGYNPTATDLVSMYGIGYSHPNAAFDGINDVLGDWGLYVAANGTARIGLDAGNGVGRATASWRAPIFYDSNDTSYYTDPASTSILNVTRHNALIAGSTSDMSNRGQIAVYSSGSPYISFHDGTTARTAYFQETSGRFYCGEVTYTETEGSFRAPLFYDVNNTGYYTDPASTSVMNQINLAGVLRRNTSAAGYLEGNYPSGVDGNSSAAIYTIGGSYQPGGTNLGNMYGCGYTVGNGTANPGLGATGWGFYVASGGTSRIFLDSDSGYGIASASWRAPVFYDSNNTAYYLDPNSTTSIRTVGSWRSDASTWDGEFAGKIQYHSSHWYIQGADLLIFRNNGGSNVFTVDQSGNVVASGTVTASSDRKLKTNIETLENGLEIVSKLRGVRFNWIESGERSVGMIAQEVEEVLPELVLETERNTLEGQESNKIKSLDYSKIVAVLIEAIKEQQIQINDLKNMIINNKESI